MSNKERIKLRENVIGYIYGTELMGDVLNSDNAFESGEYTQKDISVIEKISSSYSIFKKLILKYTKSDWTWERIKPLNRAILLYGLFEMSFNDMSLVIDVLVRYAKNFSPDDSYKFINSILEKVGKYYDEIKRNKKTT